MRLIGLCGRSGSGKSSFSKIASEYGIITIDCDAVYKELVSRPSECLMELQEAFGDEIITDGVLNRRVLAPIVFSDNEKLQILNSITHKHITAEIKKILAKIPDNSIVLLDAPTLFESGLDKECESVVAVVCNDEICLQRIVQRDGISKDAAHARLNNQKSLEFYYKNCNYVLENNGTEDEFILNSQKLIKELREEDNED